MICVNNLCYAYGKHEVLNGINFEAKSGEMLCFLGQNGAGKSTLFKCILGLLKKYDGEVKIDNKNIKELSSKERAKSIAYIPQATHSIFAYSVLDMVMMGTTVQLSAISNPSNKEIDIAMHALDKMGIKSLANRDYSKISGGEQQMVLIARALAQGVKTLVMDEPTSSLDYGNQLRVQKQLRRLVKEGYLILQSTHNPEQAYIFADRVLCIKDGMIYRQGVPKSIMDEQLIKDMYGIGVTLVESPDKDARFFKLKDDINEN